MTNGPQDVQDITAIETQEWLDSLEYVLQHGGPERVQQLLDALEADSAKGVALPFTATTPYINTIPPDKQPRYPGNRELERRIKSIIRWNAMAMVTRANRDKAGSAATSRRSLRSATLYEVALQPLLPRPRRRRLQRRPDLLPGPRLAGHVLAGVSRRPADRSRTSMNFRRELATGGGLSSYPHPWLMPEFWEFPTVSMGLGPIMAIYQARFNRYLTDRGIKDLSTEARVGVSGRRRDATSRSRSARSRWPRARSSTI